MSELHQSPERLNVRVITWTIVVALLIGATAVGAAWWMTPEQRRVRRAVIEPRGTVAGVEQGMLEDPPRGLVESARSSARLHQHGWADRDHRFAHIPITRAIDMAAAGCRPPGAGEPAFDRAADPSCPEPSGEVAP